MNKLQKARTGGEDIFAEATHTGWKYLMTTDQVKRKLAAILCADVQGYSHLMGADEEGTIRTLKTYMEVITGLIHQHRGRIVATAGDSVLAEFASVVNVVRCAVDIQENQRQE